MPNYIKMKNLYLQKKIPSGTYNQLSTFFDFSADEELLCAIWASPVIRHGFVITSKALHWYFKTSDGLKTGEIKKSEASNIIFEITPQISSENSVASLANSIAEECSKLEIRAGERAENFYITGLTEEKGKILCDILKFGFTQNALPQIDLGELVKEMPIVPLRNFSDKFLTLGDKIVEKVNDFKGYLARGFYEVTHIKFVRKRKTEIKNSAKNDFNFKTEPKTDFAQKEQFAEFQKTEEKQPPAAKKGGSSSFLLNFLDIFASLLFVAGFVVLLKPKLLTEHGFPENQIQQFGTIAIAIYTLFKSAVAFYSKKVYKKILPVILIVVSILSYFLFTYSFKMNQDGSHSIFIVTSCILALLSYFAFEYSCGYKTNTLFKKILAVIIFGIIIYVMANFAIYENKQKRELITAARNFWKEISKFCKTL